MNLKKNIIILALFSLFINPEAILAQGLVSFYETNDKFNPNYLISDIDLTDYNALTLEQIKQFVIAKGGTLAIYIDPAANLPAYWIIWQTSQEFKINPKFILAMLQKEQGLVTDPAPTPNQYDWAVGYSCYGGLCLEIYRGFAKQVRAMADKFINGYLADLNALGKYKDNYFCTFTKWCVNDLKISQDAQTIVPQNKATAALYTYNPYRGGTLTDNGKVGANYNFWKIWNSWFAALVLRPSGSLLKAAGDAKVYLIAGDTKRPFANFSAFITRYNPADILTVAQAELDQYQAGREIKFAQYSLLKDEAGSVFLAVDDSLRKIDSPEVFRTLGFNPEEVGQVTGADLAGISFGPVITLAASYPTGALIQDASNGGVYYVQSGIKYPIFAKEIIKVNYPGRKIISVHPKELDKYPKGDAILFKDGTLVKAKDNPQVYVVAARKKLPIADEASFISRGYDWSKIVETSAAAVEILPTGETLQVLDLSLLKINIPTSTPIFMPTYTPTSTATSTPIN
ncbi:MAG: hypothetical protein NTZ18_01980 [Candidatus Komeilibacteria bacterium]|nr:hypothetical protein [Candidatus Komeilibacteria bacterium]